MPINYHPKQGTILLCDFDAGFKVPEMVKRRPVVVISPPISVRPKLCTVVAISSDPPVPAMPYHYLLEVILPAPWHEGPNWIKGDMVYAVGFHRLDLLRLGRREDNKRAYLEEAVTPEQLRRIRVCVLSALGLGSLTKHLT